MPIPDGPYSSLQKWEYFQSGYVAIYHQQVALGVDATQRPTNATADEINALYKEATGIEGDCPDDFPTFASDTVTRCYRDDPPTPPEGVDFDWNKWEEVKGAVFWRIIGTMWTLEMCVQLQDCLQFGTGGKGGFFTLR